MKARSDWRELIARVSLPHSARDFPQDRLDARQLALERIEQPDDALGAVAASALAGARAERPWRLFGFEPTGAPGFLTVFQDLRIPSRHRDQQSMRVAGRRAASSASVSRKRIHLYPGNDGTAAAGRPSVNCFQSVQLSGGLAAGRATRDFTGSKRLDPASLNDVAMQHNSRHAHHAGLVPAIMTIRHCGTRRADRDGIARHC